ncbi:MAG: N-acetylmuramoyl-L-alanine amidase [Thermodesulfobacteriota bacterium]
MRPGGRKTRRLLAALALLVFFAAAAWAATEDELFRRAETARAALEKDKEAQGLRHKWAAVIKAYEQVVEGYPGSKSAEKALLAEGDLYLGMYKRSLLEADLDQALEAYRRCVRTFPKGEAAGRAQLAVGRLYYFQKKNLDRAYVELLKVELNHPRSKAEVTEARKLMAKITGRPEYKPAEPAEEKPAPAAPAAPAAPSPATVKGLRYWHNPTYTRVAIDLDREIKFTDHLLRSDPDQNKPMRLYLDLEQARIGPGVREEVKIGDGFLQKARVAQYDADTVRVVLDVQDIYNYRIFSLTNPFRIVVDVTGGRKPEEQAAEAGPEPGPEAKPGDKPTKKEPLTDLRDTALKRPKQPRGPAQSTSPQASLARQLGLGIRKVVIDPGHGGKDRGATGITGLKEKDLTLIVAQLLAAKLEKQLGLEVVLTRGKDAFLTLEERMGRANTEAADLFISIHANAHKSPKVYGLETYILNIATDKEAMAVAARENAASSKSMSDLEVILNDLMLNSKIAESGSLGAKVHKAMVGRLKKKYKGVKDLGVKQAPFYVLIGANMPSILIEMGFLTNKTEETRLKNSKYLEHLTDGVVEGIKAYMDSIKKGT